MADPQTIGAVLVVGGGISGIQTSLDLAESGYKVYLVDKSPSIGGVMAQLDKTFPTNDCSMCILAPKLVAVGRHPNIELITYAELKDLEGRPGQFRATIHKHARSVDEELCTGCGACVESCLVRFKPQKPEPRDVSKGMTASDVTLITGILDKMSRQRAALIPILQAVQDHYSYLPREAIAYVAQELEVPLTQVFQVATFYHGFSLNPKGEHTIKVCLGTACHVRGAALILDELKIILGIEPGETTDDNRYTLEAVNCLGACALGPVVMIDQEYFMAKPGSLGKMLEDFEKGVTQ